MRFGIFWQLIPCPTRLHQGTEGHWEALTGSAAFFVDRREKYIYSLLKIILHYSSCVDP
jgi:hypothetical protein